MRVAHRGVVVGALAFALSAGGLLPASAAGAGTATSNVSISPGIPLLPGVVKSNRITFASTVFSGVFRIGSCIYNGPMNAAMTASSTDTTAMGSGIVTAMSGSGSVGPTSVSMSGGGSLTRAGMDVVITLNVRVTIVGVAATCVANQVLSIAGTLTPTSQTATWITGAQFTAAYTAA